MINSGSEDQADGTVVHSMCVTICERGDSRVILTIQLRALTESDDSIIDFCTAMNGQGKMEAILPVLRRWVLSSRISVVLRERRRKTSVSETRMLPRKWKE